MERKAGPPEDFHAPQAPPPYEQTQQAYGSSQRLYVQPGPTVVATGVTVMPTLMVGPQVGPNPQPLTCNHCSSDVVTKVTFKPSLRTHLMAAILCVIGCWCCVCVPYCVDSCNNVEHQCPNCGVFLGTYRN